MESIRVHIIDEYPAVCEALAARLGSVASIEVVGAQSVFQDGLDCLAITKPDVVILELKWKSDGECEPVAAFVCRRAARAAAVIVLTSFVDEAERNCVMQAGASRYLLKDIDTKRLIDEIEAVAAEAAARFPGRAGRTREPGQAPIA